MPNPLTHLVAIATETFDACADESRHGQPCLFLTGFEPKSSTFRLRLGRASLLAVQTADLSLDVLHLLAKRFPDAPDFEAVENDPELADLLAKHEAELADLLAKHDSEIEAARNAE